MTEKIYHAGKEIGTCEVGFFQGVRISETYRAPLEKMVTKAKEDGIKLTLASGLRTQSEQIFLRKQNVKDKSKVNDTTFIATAPSSNFYPVTGLPGYSNHQSGKAFDFNVTGFPEVYKWLVENAHQFGFIRTVASEIWHWEYEPTLGQFAVVPKTHETWQHLV